MNQPARILSGGMIQRLEFEYQSLKSHKPMSIP